MCPHTSLTLVSPSPSAFLAHKRVFQHEASSLISKRQPGSLTTASASMCYHLPRVYQLDTRAEEQITAERTKPHGDEEEDTGIRPKNTKKPTGVLKNVMRGYQKGCKKNNIRAEEEQKTTARTKQREDEEGESLCKPLM